MPRATARVEPHGLGGDDCEDDVGKLAEDGRLHEQRNLQHDGERRLRHESQLLDGDADITRDRRVHDRVQPIGAASGEANATRASAARSSRPSASRIVVTAELRGDTLEKRRSGGEQLDRHVVQVNDECALGAEDAPPPWTCRIRARLSLRLLS